MKEDISKLLNAWTFDTENVAARWITGENGHPMVQLRVDLGILQMELEGRPDGQTPLGYSSLMDYLLGKEDAGNILTLDDKILVELQREGAQFYHRYLAFSALGYHDGVMRDTEHNLELIYLISRYRLDEEAAWEFYRFFPYVRMMNARAQAEKFLESARFIDAEQSLTAAVEDIKDFSEDFGFSAEATPVQEIQALNDMVLKVRKMQPKSEEQSLREKMDAAIESEDYESAATLRDQLRRLKRVSPKAT